METKEEKVQPDKPQSSDRFVAYNIKAKHVVYDSKKQESYIEQENKEDFVIAMLLDIKNTVARLEEGLL